VEGPFLAVGDPIYNQADPRWTGGFAPTPAGEGRQLSRLIGSRSEIENCARKWQSGRAAPILLHGAAASRQELTAALRHNPAVLHFATHVVIPERPEGPAFLALSLQRSGEVDYLSASEIANLRAQIGLVVLNGCRSGTGAVLAGAGLMGLTRAWLTAGARGVIATHWPIPDHAGELFETLYSSLAAQPTQKSFARALQHAQLIQLRSGGWTSQPRYWSAYFCMERY
jgi:CHAT domain-containing protein